MVDWTKPLEAVHIDGRVAPARLVSTDDHDALVYCAETDGDGEWYYTLNDPDYESNGWRIRNALDNSATIDAHSHTIGLIRKWANDRNLIEGANSQAQTVKLFEEGGEVAAAVARGNLDALKDGIGDMVVVLVILAAQNGLTLEECVAAAYEEIKDRKGRMVDGVFIREQ